MPRFVYVIFLCPMPSHATQENVVFSPAVMVDHMNKSSTLIKTWMGFVITLNLQILLTDTFVWMLFHPKTPTWTFLYSELTQPWQPHSVMAMVSLHHTVPQSGLWEMSSGLKQQQIPRNSVWLARAKKLAARYEPHDWKPSAANNLTHWLQAVLGSSRWETGLILDGAPIVCNIPFLLMLHHSFAMFLQQFPLLPWYEALPHIKLTSVGAHGCHGVRVSFFST